MAPPAKEVYESAVNLLRSKAQYAGTLRELLDFEASLDPNRDGNYYDNMSPFGVAWEVKDAPIAPAKVTYLYRIGLLHLVHRTNKYKCYCIAHPDEINKALEPIERRKGLDKIAEEPSVPQDEVDGLFQWIVGYDDIKYWIRKAISRPKPVHIALDGPPATAKSAFLLDLSRVPGARFATGTKMTNTGLYEILAYEHPKILCIDEFEKLATDAYNTIYTLCADGFIQKDQHGVHERIELDTRVFASVNDWGKVPEAIRSRFKHWELNEYDEEEYKRIVERMLPAVEGTDEALAAYIAEITAKFTRDIREAIRYARMCDTKEEVDMLHKTDLRWKR